MAKEVEKAVSGQTEIARGIAQRMALAAQMPGDTGTSEEARLRSVAAIAESDATDIDGLLDHANSGNKKIADIAGRPMLVTGYDVFKSDKTAEGYKPLFGVYLNIHVEDPITGDEMVISTGGESLVAIMDTADRKGLIPFLCVFTEIVTGSGNTVHKMRKVTEQERKYIDKARGTVNG